MQVFYSPDIKGTKHQLDEKESKHLIRVLRMREKDPVCLIDGKGNLYEGIISLADQKGCIIDIRSVTKDFDKKSYKLHIAISPPKNPERLEWFIEKSVELGIDNITPLISKNTEKTKIKKERINKIIISAMKQSIKGIRPILNEPVQFNEFISIPREGVNMIAHCHNSMFRKSIPEIYTKGENATIMIGPEGDFTKEEIDLATEKKYKPVHLGSSRLRTETAGVAACHSIYFINQ